MTHSEYSVVTQLLAEEGWGLVWGRTQPGWEAPGFGNIIKPCPKCGFRWEGRQCFDISV